MKKIITTTAFLGVFVSSLTSAFAMYFNTSPIVRCDRQITTTLQAGSESNDVYTLQHMLFQGGYLQATPNGYFGPSTIKAVKQFQRDNGISQTGIVGESTRNAVNERLCDTDVTATASYNTYSYNSGVTVVDSYDPYARVISPTPSNLGAIYSTPQADVIVSHVASTYPSTLTATPDYTFLNNQIITPATTQIQSTGIIYSSNVGYMYGIVPTPGSITITTPLANTLYNEGDTVTIAWSTQNLNATAFQILIENTSTGQSKQVAFVTGNSVSFVLTRELLNSVCGGTCDNNQQGNFRFVIVTPVTDIAGVTSNFRAMISPITIRRPYSVMAAINLNASKTPVSSNEGFRMYVNTPGVNPTVWTNLYGTAVIKLRALCMNTNVSVSIASVPCGQEFTMPISVVTSEQGVPVVITNNTWFTQDVVFEVNLVNHLGQILGTAQTKVTVNPASFNW